MHINVLEKVLICLYSDILCCFDAYFPICRCLFIHFLWYCNFLWWVLFSDLYVYSIPLWPNGIGLVSCRLKWMRKRRTFDMVPSTSPFFCKRRCFGVFQVVIFCSICLCALFVDRVAVGVWPHTTFAREKVVGVHSWQASKVCIWLFPFRDS